MPLGHHHVVDRLVEARPGVDFAAMGFDGASNFTQASSGGAFEQHVLVEVGQPNFVGVFVGAADFDPNLKGHDRDMVLSFKNDREAVGKVVARGHLEIPTLSVSRPKGKRLGCATPMTDEDEPLFDVPRASAPQRASRGTPAYGRAGATSPPPLPKPQAKTAAYGTAFAGAAVVIPAPLQRPQGADPFQEPAEPRLPVGVDAEEKLKIFRSIVKGKDEALGRGRALFQSVEQEAQQLRAAATQLKAQLDGALAELQRTADYPVQIQLLKDMLEKDTVRADDAEKKMDELVLRSAEVERERSELSSALAQVEQQLSETSSALTQERHQRRVLAEELEGLKDALATSQDRVTELARRLSEAKTAHVDLEARATANVENALREAQSSRDEHEKGQQRVAMLTQQVGELKDAQVRSEALVAALRAQVIDFEAKQERTQTALQAAQSSASTAEVDALKQENTAIKKKLVMAEKGLEAAASLRAKVSKLEAQLKGAGRK